MRSAFILSAIFAAATLAVATPSAEAGKVHVNIGVGFGNPNFGASVAYGKQHHAPAPVVFAPGYHPVYQPIYQPVVVAPYCGPVVYQPAPIVYVPSYTFVYEQQWVPPVWQTQLVGYDHCGRPVTQQVCVAQGYYRTLRYKVFSNGAKVFDGYV